MAWLAAAGADTQPAELKLITHIKKIVLFFGTDSLWKLVLLMITGEPDDSFRKILDEHQRKRRQNTMSENTIGGCSGSCHSCASSCGPENGERKPSFFDRLESISEHFDEVGEDNVLQMLNDIVAELEKEVED